VLRPLIARRRQVYRRPGSIAVMELVMPPGYC